MRMIRNRDSRRYIDWLDKAMEDIKAAEILMKFGNEDTNEAVAFHCHQCIEKALKAYLLFMGKFHFDGHNLTFLCRTAANLDNRFREWIEESIDLNRYYVETRYPSDKPMELNDMKIREIYKIAQKMYLFIEGEIASDLGINNDKGEF